MMNWKELLEEEMTYRGETLADLISITLTPEELLQEFDDRYCRVRGVPFTAWTEKTVYFPLKYDGADWVGSVSRHPDGKPTPHQGGG